MKKTIRPGASITKRAITLAISLLMVMQIMAINPTVTDASLVTPEYAIETLISVGLLSQNSVKELESTVTRQEAIVILCQLLAYNSGNADTSPAPFYDVADWARQAVAMAYNAGLVRGDEGQFGANNPLSHRDWLTFLLRALGYNDPDDFAWVNSVNFARLIGFSADTGDTFTFGDVAALAYEALLLKLNNSDLKLI